LAKLLFNTGACLNALFSGSSLPRGLHLHQPLLFFLFLRHHLPLGECGEALSQRLPLYGRLFLFLFLRHRLSLDQRRNGGGQGFRLERLLIFFLVGDHLALGRGRQSSRRHAGDLIGYVIGFLFIGLSWVTHGKLSLHQASHGAVADGALQLENRMESPWERMGRIWTRLAVRDLLLRLLRRFCQTFLRHKRQLLSLQSV
jgi:hypothetical protein